MSETIRQQADALAQILPMLARRLNTLNVNDPTIDLPVAQLRLCGILQYGPMTMSALGTEMGISLSAVTQLADRLGEAGLVERLADPDDRRVKCLQLTRRGREIMSARKRRRVERIEGVLAALSSEERCRLLECLRSLLDAANGVQV